MIDRCAAGSDASRSRVAGAFDSERSPACHLLRWRAPDSEAPDEAALRLATELLTALRTLIVSKQPARVWVITEAAVPVVGGDAVRLEGACLWGAGKAAALELPDLWGGLVDLPLEFADADADRLVRALAGDDVGDDDQWALRAGHWFVPRLAAAPLQETSPSASFRHDAVYWIAGGSGALGKHVLQTLVEGGARHIVLTGRREFALDGIFTPNADVRFLRADLVSIDDCARVLAHIDASGLPLAGIVHAAGVANECFIERLTSDLLREVAASKVAGAWNLHTVTQGRHLDLFVCFSSIASLWGSAAQAHYAAANHFLDMLCEHRRSLGQPGLAIAWGPWSGGGMVTPAVQARLVRAGLDLLDPEAAMALFVTLVGSRYSRVAAVNVRWEPFVATFTARRASPFLSRFLMKPGRDTTDSPSILSALDACTADQLRTRLRTHIGGLVAESLGVGRVPDVDRGFFDMGLDSLDVVAIRGRLTADCGVSVSSADMFNYPTINALTGRIMQLLRPDLETRADDPVEPVDDSAETMSPRELMERIGLEFDALGNVTE